MKDLKKAIKALTERSEVVKPLWRQWLKPLWKNFVLLAAFVATAALALMKVSCDTILPVWIYGREVGDVSLVFGLVGIDMMWLTVFVLAVVLAGYMAYRSHKAMAGVLDRYSRLDMTKNRRNLLLTENTLLLIAACIVGGLPVVVLFASSLAAALSGMALDDVVTPRWVPVAFWSCCALAVILLQVVATFVRGTFRKLEFLDCEIEINEEDNTIDSLVDDDNSGIGFAAIAPNRA